jgi:hypothetical protein
MIGSYIWLFEKNNLSHRRLTAKGLPPIQVHPDLF